MILFKVLRWKNLLSTGNVFTEITLDTHQQTLIVGENGAGKSTILDALHYVLYGKPFRKINKPQLINTINSRELLVECEFQIGKNYYKVRRGIKPSIFEIYSNDTLINIDASVSDYQEVLEKQILKINQKSFSQIVVLGSAIFVPFMQLSAANRREVIEDLLDIQIFSTMNTLLKEKIQHNQSQITEQKHSVSKLEFAIESEQKFNEILKQTNDDHIAARMNTIDVYMSNIRLTKKSIKHIQQEIATLKQDQQTESKIKKRSEKLVTLSEKLNYKKEQLEDERTFFQHHDKCPQCKQNINEDHKNVINIATNQSIDEINQARNKLSHELNTVNSQLLELAKLDISIKEKESEILSMNMQCTAWHNMIKDMEADVLLLKQKQSENKQTHTTDLTIQLNEAVSKFNMLVEERKILSAASVMLKDDGIKSKIICQFVPIINKLLNKYLASMDFFVNFSLDENFEEKILSRFRDEFSYASFSEGEKSRIDLALLFTWRAIAKLRNSMSTNLLILDEVFDGSLDAQGNEELLKILQTLTEGSNVFVISHKTDAYLDKFERVLKFEKNKNFSRVVKL